MRRRLAALNGRGGRFQATFVRYGLKYDSAQDERVTVLLTEVCDESGDVLCGHVWIDEALPFQAAGLKYGDRVEFGAKVISYRRGFARPRRIKLHFRERREHPDRFPRDYTLHQITRVHPIRREESA